MLNLISDKSNLLCTLVHNLFVLSIEMRKFWKKTDKGVVREDE